MSGKLNMVLIFFFVLAAFLQGSVATTYNVGDANGWAIPSDTSAYDTWAAGKKFVVGDVLFFDFPTGAHDVAQVTKSGYDGCDGNNPISIENTGPASITLTSSGQKYYICTIESHCSFSQKLAITVASSTPSSPPPKSATPPPMATSPPPASPPPKASTPQPASPPPKASSPAPHVSPPTASTPVPAVAPRASTPVPAMEPSPPPKFHTPAPTPSIAASPQSSSTPPTSTGASSPTSVASTPSTDAPAPSSASSLGVTILFTAFLITATAMMRSSFFL